MRPWHAFYPPGLPPRATYPAHPAWGFLAAGAARTPTAPALVAEGRTWTYGALWARVEEVAGFLHAEGARPGDRVLLRLGNSADFVLAHQGALRAGCIAVSAPTGIGAAEFDALRDDCAPALVLGADDALGTAPPPPPPDADVAVLQYTSGTTGRPKGAVMSHANLVANALQNARWFGWTPGDVQLCVLPLCHTWGLSCGLLSTFAAGASLVLVDGFDAARTFALVRKHRATILYGSATMLYRLLDAGGDPADLATLRHVKAGAMLTPGDLKARWDAFCPRAPLQQGYGLTEASPESHNNPPHRFRAGTVGVPLQDTDCRLADDGEVLLKGPQVTRGYWNRPEATAAAFTGDGWLRTGDVGTMDGDGYLTIVDRKKDLLKFRGYTVVPAVVERALLACAGVREAAVVGREEHVDGEIPVAYVVADARVDEAVLRAWCDETLARWQRPRAFRFVASLPRNRLGKVLRRALRESERADASGTIARDEG